MHLTSTAIGLILLLTAHASMFVMFSNRTKPLLSQVHDIFQYATLSDIIHSARLKQPMLMPSESKAREDLVSALKGQRTKIQRICDVAGVAGVSIAVIDHGETIFKDNLGYCDLEKKETVTSDTIFHISSMTKSFTGYCIHKLRTEGKLALEDQVRKHLPEAESRDDCVATQRTIADLLGHRTGLQKGGDDIWLGANGELMITKDQVGTVFSHLRPQSNLRSRFLYSNIGYAVLGEIISKVTGRAYGAYLKEQILDPLGMTRTKVTKESGLPDDTSLAYSTLDDGKPYNVPLPGISAGAAMGAAGGLLSTTNDLVRYYKMLMSSWRDKNLEDIDESKGQGNDGKLSALDDPAWLLTPLQIMTEPILREKSYASGLVRSQLPISVGDLGVNAGLVDKMPTLANGTNSRLAVWHQGSLVGTTSFVMMLPETESAVVVLTNTMALNDAADWIGQLLIETLIDSPIRNDYVQLAFTSASRALEKFAKTAHEVEQGMIDTGPIRPLRDYTGSYIGFGGTYRIQVVEGANGLEMLLQGRQSQKYELRHHHDNTFTWFMSWNEQIRKARFVNYAPTLYFIHFKVNEANEISYLNWVQDAAIAQGEDYVKAKECREASDNRTKL